ncbi:MAG: ECF-type sigma factor [Planctomycetota bacterium]
MPLEPRPATQMLRRMQAGERAAEGELLDLLYAELRRTAQGLMRSERGDHTLQPTALVHEAWVRLVDVDTARSFEGVPHFMRSAARAMRHVLVDHARARTANKRGGGAKAVPLDAVLAAYEERSLDVLEIDEALAKLAGIDAQLARVVELRTFGGLTIAETAEACGVSTPTVERAWRTASAWLRAELDPEETRDEHDGD